MGDYGSLRPKGSKAPRVRSICPRGAGYSARLPFSASRVRGPSGVRSFGPSAFPEHRRRTLCFQSPHIPPPSRYVDGFL